MKALKICSMLVLAIYALNRPAVPGHDAAIEKAKKEVTDLENRWLATEDDPQALESILADDFVHVVPVGFVSKDEQISFMRKHPAPRRGPHRFETLRVRIYGDTAIANGAVLAIDPNQKIQKTLFTDVFVLRNGRWQAVNAQELPSDPGQ